MSDTWARLMVWASEAVHGNNARRIEFTDRDSSAPILIELAGVACLYAMLDVTCHLNPNV